jgi:hypothetical protein
MIARAFFIARKQIKEGKKMDALKERAFYRTQWLIRRYENQEAFEAGVPSPVIDAQGELRPAESVIEGNTLLNGGIQALLNLMAGLATPTKWDAGNAKIGVGDNSSAAANTQTGLQGANKAWAVMANGYPSRANQTVTWQASFDANTANYGWQEFDVINANNDTAANSLNRVVSNQGTKTAGQVWTVSIQITLA